MPILLPLVYFWQLLCQSATGAAEGALCGRLAPVLAEGIQDKA